MNTKRTFIFTTLALLALLLVPQAAAESIAIRVNEPFEVDGTVYEAGRLTLREVSDYNPVTTLNEICIGRECVGIFVAREKPGNVVAERNEVLFTRATDGHLVLEAVAFAGGPLRGLQSLDEQTGQWMTAAERRERNQRGTLVAGQ